MTAPSMQAVARPTELRRVMNAFLGAAIVVGGTIGAGILRVPGTVAGKLGQPAVILLAWLAGGLLAAMGAACYAELATAIPKAGGPYVYARRAYGEFAGFAVGWADWATSVCGLAAISVPVGEFAEKLLPGIGDHAHAVAAGTLAALALLNWFGLKLGARVQQWLSLAKIFGLLFIVVGCFALPRAAVASPVAPSAQAATFTLSFVAVMLAMQYISETYAGWNSSIYFSEEDRDSNRNVPRALFWGILAVTATYLLVNAALLYALPADVLTSSELPVAAAAQGIFGDAADRIVTTLAIVSLVGILNVTVMFTARILFAMSRDRLLPKRISQLNHSATPGMALLVCVIPAILLAAGTSFETLFLITGFLGVAVNCALYIAYFVLRRREPDLPRPYRAFGHPWVPAFAALLALVLLVGFVVANLRTSLYAIAMLAASYPFYRWSRFHVRGR
ncbi:MAG TPA: APC family permease [Steroidobacteraceae bacterium]|nr:APC family permease [Steroidobacteraceae bacterium]